MSTVNYRIIDFSLLDQTETDFIAITIVERAYK